MATARDKVELVAKVSVAPRRGKMQRERRKRDRDAGHQARTVMRQELCAS